jgi:hypothetical protein
MQGKEKFISSSQFFPGCAPRGCHCAKCAKQLQTSAVFASVLSTGQSSFFNPHAFLMCSSYCLYALFALLVVARFTRPTAPITNAQLPASALAI